TGEGIGALWSTAYLDEAEACDRVLLLNQGKLLFEGIPSDLTQRVEGRVFKLSGAAGRRRAALARVLEEENVVDGVIQGEAIRLVMKDAGDPGDLFSHIGGPDARIAPAAPRFEDAFVDMLGGGPGGRSKLAEATHTRPADVGRSVIESKG